LLEYVARFLEGRRHAHHRSLRARLFRRRGDLLFRVLAAVLAGQLSTRALLLATIGSLAAAIWTARYVWHRTENAGETGLLAMTFCGALVVGTVGFIGGFFGPMIFAPDANQGPLLGLLITEPLGFVAGGIGGFVYGLVRRGRAASA
jgi:hypothetical protein